MARSSGNSTSVMEKAELLDELKQSLGERGYEVDHFSSDVEHEYGKPGFSESSAVESVENLLRDERTSSWAALAVYPSGVEDTNAGVTIKYPDDRDALVVSPYTHSFQVTDAEGIEHLLESREDVTSPRHGRTLELKYSEYMFETDKVVAAIEKDLMDLGYDVLVGNSSCEENRAVNQFP